MILPFLGTLGGVGTLNRLQFAEVTHSFLEILLLDHMYLLSLNTTVAMAENVLRARRMDLAFSMEFRMTSQSVI